MAGVSDDAVVERADLLADCEDLMDWLQDRIGEAFEMCETASVREIAGEAGVLHGRLVELFDGVSQCRTDLTQATGLIPPREG